MCWFYLCCIKRKDYLDFVCLLCMKDSDGPEANRNSLKDGLNPTHVPL